MPRFRSPQPTGHRTLLDAVGHLACDEDGAAYTLSYVMVIPMYALLMCAIVEMALMLTAKLGTTYAAYAAARSASVWSSATEWEKAEKRAKRAAIQAMVPFASGTQENPIPAPPAKIPDDVRSLLTDYLAFRGAYETYAKEKVPEDYLNQKYAYAVMNTDVQFEGGKPAKWDSPITAKVTYKFPFNVPGIGIIFGKKDLLGRYYFPISSVVSLPNEGPQNDANTIGIGYGKFD